ncbi:DUF3099 domain-containing protein [Corynebacterium sp. zg-331]|uniref:DUF3099 domain-containing protein n=1 Tax=unclassified Corynebacterium TaxID=2624378 RepID=UPI00128B3370|nr:MULTISPECIES: DUF3099 domain-containing protein [unclassified Corynebacterium]MBC3185412.1 DUF3099 domain-containing protein [Corynebacterium sp. zg-331]MPV51907.1 DUF3099 domain-containing protein [Corynebacterium sp. zg331]
MDSHGASPDPGTIDAPVGASPPRRRVLPGPRRRVALITDAHRTPEQNLRHRERLYGIMQGVRLPLIALALLALVAWNNWVIAGVLFCVSIPMPWIAVVIANGRGEPRDPRVRRVYKPALARQQQATALEARAGKPEISASTSADDHARPDPAKDA